MKKIIITICLILLIRGSKVQVLDEELKKQTLTNCECFFVSRSELGVNS